jgi:hypothetical protein
MKLLTLAFCLSSFVTWSAKAENVYDPQFQRIQSVELVEVIEDELGNEVEVPVMEQKLPSDIEALMDLAQPVANDKANIGEIIMIADKLIALGEKIYKIIEKGKPVVTMNSTPVSVLPKDEKGGYVDAFYLENWKAPKSQKFRVITKNYLGMTPASFEFMLIYTYGGSLNGKGKYLTGAQIKPTAVDVKWGYKLDASFKVQSIMNQGTNEDPVAAAVLMIDYRIWTILQDTSHNKTFFVNGKGQASAY